MRRYLPSLVFFATILAVSPAIGEVTERLFRRFPESLPRLLTLALAVVAAGLLTAAALRIRDHRPLRYGGLALVAALLLAQWWWAGRGVARVDAVERVHLLEYGVLAFLVYRALRPTGSTVRLMATFLAVAGAGTAEELLQWLVPQRVGEIRDVLLNAFAAACGLLFAVAWDPPGRPRRRLRPSEARGLAGVAAALAFFLGIFVYEAHLGYEVDDPELGRFRSWYTAAELHHLARLRARQWAADPPSGLPAWGIEDHYLTEAAWHAQHRNASYRAGLYLDARHADRILEKYYTPFLDLPSFRGSGVHRYPPAVERELAQRAPRLDPHHRSPVLRDRIWVWPPKRWFLAVWLPTVAGLAWRARPRPEAAGRPTE